MLLNELLNVPILASFTKIHDGSFLNRLEYAASTTAKNS